LARAPGRPDPPACRRAPVSRAEMVHVLLVGWDDALRFSPVELLERLAVLIPRPRINLVLYDGILPSTSLRAPRAPSRGGPRAASRKRVVAFGKLAAEDAALADTTAPTRPAPPGGRRWAELRRRSDGLDVLACPRCGGRRRLVALIDERSVIARILRHLGFPTERRAPRPGRAPPLLDEGAAP